MKILEDIKGLDWKQTRHADFRNFARKRKWFKACQRSRNYEEKCTKDPVDGNLLVCLIFPPLLAILTIVSIIFIPFAMLASLNYRLFKERRILRGAYARFKKMRMPK